MSVISDEYIKKIISDISTALKLKDSAYSKQNFEDIAQNYFGVLIPINLSGKNVYDEHVNVPLVLKLAPSDERYRVSGAVTLFFAKEIFAYTNILHKYIELQKTIPQTSQFVMPKCYYVRKDYCQELIAIENMCVNGNYKPFVDSMFLDLNHIIVALTALGRFHALSYVFEKQDRKHYGECKEFCVPLSEKTNKRFMEILVDRLNKALVKFNDSDYALFLETLKHNCVFLIESVSTAVKSLCLCHGDIWKENILFKYEDNLPTSACLIDYQTVRVCSPAFDVLYLIITSTTSNLRKKHFEYLVATYYQTFEQTLQYANYKYEEIYSRDLLNYDLKIVAPACLIIANTAMWLACGLQEEGHVKSKVLLTTDDAKRTAIIQYKDIISGIITDLSDNKLINV